MKKTLATILASAILFIGCSSGSSTNTSDSRKTELCEEAADVISEGLSNMTDSISLTPSFLSLSLEFVDTSLESVRLCQDTGAFPAGSKTALIDLRNAILGAR